MSSFLVFSDPFCGKIACLAVFDERHWNEFSRKEGGTPKFRIFYTAKNPQYSIRIPFVSFPLAGHHHCQFRVLLPKFLLGPSGWHACSSRVGLPHVNCLISDISPSARPSSSRCLGPRRGAQPPARRQSYRLLFSDPLNKGVGLGVVFVGISTSHLLL